MVAALLDMLGRPELLGLLFQSNNGAMLITARIKTYGFHDDFAEEDC